MLVFLFLDIITPSSITWIHFIDSGGQLQYHDILPLFIQNPMVAIFVLKLSDELSHHPAIEFHEEGGKRIGKPYQSSLSHKQILQHCLGAFCSQSARPLIIIIGTHQDVENSCTESRTEKNQQLKELLDSNFRLLYTEEQGDHKIIFAVNCLAPTERDRHIAQVLRKEIISESPKQLIKMPIAWASLEVALRRGSHDGVLSLAECRVSAERFQIEGGAFAAALHHLVHHNVFLQYPEVLPQTVFCDPQVILTKVTELVKYHNELRDNPKKSVVIKSDRSMFRDHGMLSLEILMTFPRHYKEGLFTPQHFLELLVSRSAIIKTKDKEYLMPALLPHRDPVELSKDLQSSASLMIRFVDGYIPSGLFCSLVIQLLSFTFGWEVYKNKEKSFCLYRNCVKIKQKGYHKIMTLVDMFSYIEVNVDEPSAELCREVRRIVTSAIKKACNVLQYHTIEYEDAFLCSCDPSLTHIAVVTYIESKYKLNCPIKNDKTGNLSSEQEMWLSMDSNNEFGVSKLAMTGEHIKVALLPVEML